MDNKPLKRSALLEEAGGVLQTAGRALFSNVHSAQQQLINAVPCFVLHHFHTQL